MEENLCGLHENIACAEELSELTDDLNSLNLDGEKSAPDGLAFRNEENNKTPENSEDDQTPNNPENELTPNSPEIDQTPNNPGNDQTPEKYQTTNSQNDQCSKNSKDNQTQDKIPDDQAPNNAQDEQLVSTEDNQNQKDIPDDQACNNVQDEQLVSTEDNQNQKDIPDDQARNNAQDEQLVSTDDNQNQKDIADDQARNNAQDEHLVSTDDNQNQKDIPDDQARNNVQDEQTPKNAQNLKVPKNAQNEQLFITLSVSPTELRKKIIREEELTKEDIVQGLQDPDLVTMSIAAREARRKTTKPSAPSQQCVLPHIVSMVEAGVINPLVNALDKNHCQTLQYEATWAIANIARLFEHETLVKAGVIPKLISLVTRGEVLGERSLDALDNIIIWRETRDAALDNGVLSVLLPRMTPDTPISTLRRTVKVFRNLCRTESQLQLEYLAPALPYMSELLVVADEEVVDNITEALNDFLKHGVNFIEEAQNTPMLLPRLVALLNHKRDDVKEPIYHSILAMIRSIVSQDAPDGHASENEIDNQTPENSENYHTSNNSEHDLTPKIAEKLRSPKYRTTTNSQNDQCSKNSKDNQNQNKIPDDQAPNNAQDEQTPKKAQNLQVPKNAPNEQLFSTLSLLQRELREKIIREEELNKEDIVQGLQDPDLVTMSIAAREARRKTQQTYLFIKPMVEAGVINPLVNALDKNDCQTLQYEAAWAIANISAMNVYIKALVDAGAIPKLISLVASGEVLAERSLDALHNIIIGPEASEDALDNGVLCVLLPRMTPDTPINLLRRTVKVFLNLCCHVVESPVKLEYLAPALPYISELLLVTDGVVLAKIIWALLCFIKNKDFIEEVQNTPKLLPRLVALLDHKSDKVKLATIRSVSTMLELGTDIQRDRCLDAECLPRLLLLLDCNNWWFVTSAACTIRDIFFAGTENQKQRAIDSGVLTHLQRLLTTQDIGHKRIAAEAILILCKNGSREHTDVLLRSECLKPFCALLTGYDYVATRYVSKGLKSLIEAGKNNGLIDDIVLKLNDIGVLELVNELEENE